MKQSATPKSGGVTVIARGKVTKKAGSRPRKKKFGDDGNDEQA